MFSFVKKVSVRIFVGKNQWSVKNNRRHKILSAKKNSRQKNSSLAKKIRHFFADFFSSDKVLHIYQLTEIPCKSYLLKGEPIT